VSESLQQIFDRAAVGIAQMTTSGRYLLVNDRYCEMLGRTRQELLTLGMQDITHPDHLPTTLDAFINAIETGASLLINQQCVRGDGTPVWVRNSVSIGRDDRGTAAYVVTFAQQIEQASLSQPVLHEPRDDVRLLLDSAADGFYCVDINGLTTICNAAFLRMLGFKREEDVIGKDVHDVIHHTRPDGSPYAREDGPIHKVMQSGRHVHVTDEFFFRLDGTSFPVEYWVRPIVRNGEIEGAACTFVDLTERKQMEARQQMLNHELAHRVKNTLAMVQAIVSQTLRNSPTPGEAVQSIDRRLVALGNAHVLLTRTRWGNASMMDVVEGALAAHRSDSHQVEITGPRIELGAKAALAVTMALHELCTNAAKYGALSNDRGTVEVEWTVTGGASDSVLHLSWKERGGPPVTPPTRKGFGSRLIGQLIGSDLNARTSIDFAPAGVHWSLQAPLEALRQ
jgi:PAS domain S-box-containing protein